MLINNKEDLRKAVDQLLEWDEAYNNNNPLVSDKEYDDLYFQVAEAENNLGMVSKPFPFFITHIHNVFTNLYHTFTSFGCDVVFVISM